MVIALHYGGVGVSTKEGVVTFNPSEPRDWHGRWTSGGESGSGTGNKPYAATLMQWGKFFDSQSAAEKSQMDVQLAASSNMIPNQVEERIKRILRGMTGLDNDAINKLYESFVEELSIWDAPSLEGISFSNGVATMTKEQFETIMSTINDMPPDQARTARDAIEKGIREGRVVIK